MASSARQAERAERPLRSFWQCCALLQMAECAQMPTSGWRRRARTVSGRARDAKSPSGARAQQGALRKHRDSLQHLLLRKQKISLRQCCLSHTAKDVLSSSLHPDLLIPNVLLNETCSECPAKTSANESPACTELQGLVWGVHYSARIIYN